MRSAVRTYDIESVIARQGWHDNNADLSPSAAAPAAAAAAAAAVAARPSLLYYF